MKRSRLIDELTDDLRPVAPPAGSAAVTVVWLAVAWAAVVAMTLATGPLREGFAGQLAASPRYVFETFVAFSAGAVAAFGVFERGIPGPERPLRTLAPGLSLFALWAGLLVYGMYDPATEASLRGKRPHCFIEGIVFSLPPLFAVLYALRRRVVLSPRGTAVAAALAAGSLPALVMSFACAYEPRHMLEMHLGVVPVVAAACVAGVALFRPRI